MNPHNRNLSFIKLFSLRAYLSAGTKRYKRDLLKQFPISAGAMNSAPQCQTLMVTTPFTYSLSLSSEMLENRRFLSFQKKILQQNGVYRRMNKFGREILGKGRDNQSITIDLFHRRAKNEKNIYCLSPKRETHSIFLPLLFIFIEYKNLRSILVIEAHIYYDMKIDID